MGIQTLNLTFPFTTLFSSIRSIDLKQIDCQLFLQQNLLYSGSLENYSWGTCNHVSQAQLLFLFFFFFKNRILLQRGKGSWEHNCKQSPLEELRVQSLVVSLQLVREGNGNPLQCSCLENPRDREA